MALEASVGFERLPRGHRHALPDPRRADAEQLQRAVRVASQSPIVSAVLDVADAVLLVLNAERQIVALNGRAAKGRRPSELLGLRPGEAFGCVNASGAGGCGAAPACETCGALGAILGCQARRRPVESECVMRCGPEQGAGTALEFSVRATPVLVDGSSFTAVALRDVSDEKRRQALEQIFFHDVLNTVGGLRGWAELLRRPGADPRRASERIELLSRQLEREIRDHRALVDAERGTLVPERTRVRLADMLRDLDQLFAWHAATRGRSLEVAPPAPELELEIDAALLLRVLVNMVRNALEATQPGGRVRVWCERIAAGEPADAAATTGALRLCVWNGTAIPADLQVRVFQRSFSTKAERGRGLGTYSMKLLGERYLGGRVSFASDAQSGTVFSLEVPLDPVASA